MIDVRTIIHSDPEILGGTPVFLGTRVPAQSLFDYLDRRQVRVPAGAGRLGDLRAAATERLARARAHVESRLEPQPA